MSETAPLLETIEVSKRYPDGAGWSVAVDRVSFAVRPAELVALRGPSGSGKTTLLGLAGAMIAPSSGDVRLLGESIVHLRDRHRTALRRHHVGFVFQELALLGDMSLLENVLLPLVPEGMPKSAESRARALLDRFGLAAKVHARARTLSGGERQRGAIARALIGDPRVLLLDEPTAHLDAENAAALVGLLAGLRDDGRAIVCATHDPRLAEDSRVDRSLVMADGRLVR